MVREEVKNILEFALLAAGEPLAETDLKRLFDGDEDVPGALKDLESDWEGRSLRLAESADGWQFVSREGYLDFLRRLRPKKPARLSRQLMEVLAFIAYRQPATRGDIEQVRGVSVSSMQLAALEEFGWIEEVGRRETPGRPILYGTTSTFLNDLAISSLEELPTMESVEGSELDFNGGGELPLEAAARNGNESDAESAAKGEDSEEGGDAEDAEGADAEEGEPVASGDLESDGEKGDNGGEDDSNSPAESR